jgi:hypothetical protein
MTSRQERAQCRESFSLSLALRRLALNWKKSRDPKSDWLRRVVGVNEAGSFVDQGSGLLNSWDLVDLVKQGHRTQERKLYKVRDKFSPMNVGGVIFFE